MPQKDIEKIRYAIWSKQQEFDDDANWCYEARAFYDGLQWALDEIEKLEITEETDNE